MWGELMILELDFVDCIIYNGMFIMYGIVMLFLWIFLFLVGLVNYFVFIMIGVWDMVFFCLNVVVFWMVLVVGILMMVSFFVFGGFV